MLDRGDHEGDDILQRLTGTESPYNPKLYAARQMEEALPKGCRLVMLGDVMKAGKAAPAAPMFIAGKDGAPADPMISLFYTSGSTGLPKGAMFTERVWRCYWCARAARGCAAPPLCGCASAGRGAVSVVGLQAVVAVQAR